MIPLRSDNELRVIRASGRITARVIQKLTKVAKAGISTAEIDHLAEELIRKENAIPAFKGYRGFPASVCTSVNEEIVHGIPGERKLQESDIISIDLGVNLEGYFSDAAVTLAVGRVGPGVRRLLKVTRDALLAGIKQAQPDKHLSDISHAVQSLVERNGFSVVRDFVGHGIGRNLHEEPEIPNFGKPNAGPRLKKGMVLAIEPMVNMGSWELEVLGNGWTAVTKDRRPSAHFEHTVAVTENGPQILTLEG